MELKFLNRQRECARLQRLLADKGSGFACIYGRRRCGKSRLLREILPVDAAVYYAGDEREAPLQRESLAIEISRLIPGFADVSYPDWNILLQRWWKESPAGATLIIDEFPYLAGRSPELPSLLQKHFDANSRKNHTLILCGSSQTMMHGLILDADAPLFGRATEIIRIEPLSAAWIAEGLNLTRTSEKLEAYTLWGGVPRYWELAAGYDSVWSAYEMLVLDPMGVLHNEPDRLLHEDMRDVVQTSSILSLVGRGCHRISEVAGRLGKPASSLSRPFRKLLDMGIIDREIPFAADAKSTKHALYSVRDPFLATWYRHVLPNRSLLERGFVDRVSKSIRADLDHRKAECWERLVREAIPFLDPGGVSWLPASRWWGTSTDRSRMELDVVAESSDGKRLLLGEAKLSIADRDVDRLLFELERKAAILPFADTYQDVGVFVFAANASEIEDRPDVVGPEVVFAPHR